MSSEQDKPAPKDEREILSGPMTAPPSGHVDLGEEEAQEPGKVGVQPQGSYHFSVLPKNPSRSLPEARPAKG